MAERRMISRKIIDSARFLKMPISTRVLYYDLCLRADDDGVVEAFNVIRATGASEDDLRVLVAKEFVKVLNEDLVSFIIDWREHNFIRADRKIDSIYKNLLLLVVPDADLVEKRERADRKKEQDGDGTTQGQQMDGIGKDRLGKDRLGEDSIGQVSVGEDRVESERVTAPTPTRFAKPTVDEIDAYCRERANKVDAQAFFDFYESKGWVVGKQKMKCWRAAVRTWERRDQYSAPGRPQGQQGAQTSNPFLNIAMRGEE